MGSSGLLASDMDGTVIPLDNRPERSTEIAEFNRLITLNPKVRLAYITGRHLELGLAGVARHRLPLPDIFVCDVGTSIYQRVGETWQPDQVFRAELTQAWHGLSGPEIARLLGDLTQLTPQEDERQQEFKQSYYTPLDQAPREIENAIRKRLLTADIKVNIISSVDPIKNIGLVDVLPTMAAKDYALNYLRHSLDLAHDRVVYAGDSGNDLLALVSGFKAIVVNNTAEAVKEEVRCQAAKKGISNRIFFARADYVRGVIEGCRHFNLFPQPGE